MMFAVLIALIGTAAASSSSTSVSSSTTVCIPTIPTSVTPSLPASIASEIDDATYYEPDITTIGSIISTVELSVPTFYYVETVIESYEHSYPSLISYIEEAYSSPWIVTDTATFSYLTYEHSSLASAISYLVSVESSFPSLSAAQYTLQQVEYTQSSILTYLSYYTDIVSSTVYSATVVIDSATLVSPSILATVLAVSTEVYSYSTVSSAVSSLSYYVYSLPSTVDSYILTIISSPSTVMPSVVSYIASCYPTVYSDLSYITEFTVSHSSIVTALTNYLYVASSVSSVGTAVYEIVSYQMPTFYDLFSTVASLTYEIPSLSTDLYFVSYVTATSPTLYYAFSTIEASFYSSPSIASSIYDALVSPSSVVSPTAVSYEEISHQSLVSAIDSVLSWESVYYSSASIMSSVVYTLTSAFESVGTIITDESYLVAATSPSFESVISGISAAVDTYSSAATDLSYITSLIYYSPTLSCYEGVLGYYAYYYFPTLVSIWTVLNSPSEVTSSYSTVSYYLTEYSTLASAVSYVVSLEYYYPTVYYAQVGVFYADYVSSSAVTDYYYDSYYASSIISSLETVSSTSISSVSSSSYSS